MSRKYTYKNLDEFESKENTKKFKKKNYDNSTKKKLKIKEARKRKQQMFESM